MEALKTLISAIPHPVFVTEADSNLIRLANEAAQKSSQDTVLANRPLSDIFKTVVLPDSGKVYGQLGQNWYQPDEKLLTIEQTQWKLIELKPQPGSPDDEMLQSWKNMIAVMLHRLRSPLTGINGYLEMMEEENTDPSLDKRFGSIYKGLHHVFDLMDELEVLYNIPNVFDDSDFSQVNLHSLVQEVSIHLDPKEQKRIALPSPPAQNPSNPNSHPEILKKIVQQLLENALQHGEDAPVTVHISSQKGGSITVENKTKPLDETIASQLFHPFITSRADNLGIGLTKAFLHARQLGGTIFPEMDGHSIQFTLKLPVS